MNNNKFHPSLFETTSGDVPKDERTLVLVQEQRSQRLPDAALDTLVSPGRYTMTPDDASVKQNNTRSLLTNIHGDSLLTQMFFSETNIVNLQHLVQFLVFKETKYVVDAQSSKELMIIMRGIFLEYSAHPGIISDDMPAAVKQRMYNDYTKEVSRLNEIVLNYVVPKVVSGLQQYLDYLRDASTQPYQMNSPKNDSISGQRQYRSVTQVFFGGDL